MLEIQLIRHGMTEGNKYGRYIGVTDEPLCEEGKEALKKFSYNEPEMLFVSPLLRCRETADILFPNKEQRIIENLSECNFGEFENKNYKELDGSTSYQAWVDSNGTLPFPGGESPEGFKERSLKGFFEVVEICRQCQCKYAAVVAHGGTIMSVMEALAEEKKEFYQWHVKNGEGYLIKVAEDGNGEGCQIKVAEDGEKNAE